MAGGISPVSPDSLYFYILSLYWSLGVQIFPVCVCFCRGVLHWRSRLPEVVLSSNNQEGAVPNTLPRELNEENTTKTQLSVEKGRVSFDGWRNFPRFATLLIFLFYFPVMVPWRLDISCMYVCVCVCFCRGFLHWRSRLSEVVLSSNNQEGAAPNTLPCELNEENTKKRN